MTKPFDIVKQALEESLPSNRSWRESLRRRLPADRLHDIIANFAEGKAHLVALPDGRCSAPIIPSPAVSLQAAIFLHETLHGKAVAQTEIQKAEQEAKEFESIRALDDDVLEREAAKILEARRVSKLTPGAEFAEFTVEPETIPVQEPDLADRIWQSTPSEEQDT